MEENLGSHVARRPRGVFHIVNFPLFADPKVSQSQIALLLKYNIFRLDVPMDEPFPVDVLQGLHQTSSEKLDLIFVESLLDTHVKPEVSSRRQVH
jgi:hypothetical protein